VCRGAQLFFYLGAEVREREVSRLLTWSLGSGANKSGGYRGLEPPYPYAVYGAPKALPLPSLKKKTIFNHE